MTTHNINTSSFSNQDTENNLNPNAFLMIPAYVVLNPKVDNPTAILFGWLNSLSNKYGYCWATNDYLAKLTGVKKRELQNRLQTLRDLDYIRIHLGKDWNRKIYTCNHYSQWPKEVDPEEFKKIFPECTDMHGEGCTSVHGGVHQCAPKQDNKENKISVKNITSEAAPKFVPKKKKPCVVGASPEKYIEKSSKEMAFASQSKHFDDEQLRIGFIRSGFVGEEVDMCLNYFKIHSEYLASKSNPVGYCIGIMRNKLAAQRQQRILEEPLEEYVDVYKNSGTAKQQIESLHQELLSKSLTCPLNITSDGVEVMMNDQPTFVLYRIMDDHVLYWIKQKLQRVISPELFTYQEVAHA